MSAHGLGIQLGLGIHGERIPFLSLGHTQTKSKILPVFVFVELVSGLDRQISGLLEHRRMVPGIGQFLQFQDVAGRTSECDAGQDVPVGVDRESGPRGPAIGPALRCAVIRARR